MKILYILCFSLFVICSPIHAQFREVGTWKYYVNNSEFFDLENVNGNLFVNAKRLLFDVSVQPTDVSSYSKVNGLSDYTISTMAFHEPAQTIKIESISLMNNESISRTKPSTLVKIPFQGACEPNNIIRMRAF